METNPNSERRGTQCRSMWGYLDIQAFFDVKVEVKVKYDSVKSSKFHFLKINLKVQTFVLNVCFLKATKGMIFLNQMKLN